MKKQKIWQTIKDEDVQMTFACTNEKCQRKNVKVCVKPNERPVCEMCGFERKLAYQKTEVLM